MTTRRTSARDLAGAVAGAIVLVSFATTEPSYAQPAKPTPSTSAQDSATAEARARFEEGIKLAEAGEHESARLKFSQAWALFKSPAILFNLARSEQLTNHPVEALEHYRQFAKTPPDPKVTDVQRQRAAENIAELAKKVGQIEIEAPTGARITVDGRAVEAGTTDPVPVTPGKHVVEAVFDGKVKSVTVECTVGTITKAKLIESASVGPAASPPPRNASTESNNGSGSGSKSGSKSDSTTTSPPAEEQAGFWTPGRIAGLGVFGGGLIGLGAGVGFHMAAEQSEKNVNALRGSLPEPRSSACNVPGNEVTCTKLRVEIDNQNMRNDIRTGLFIGGGVLVVGGAVLFLVSSPKSEPTRGGPRVIPFASSRDAGIAVIGRF